MNDEILKWIKTQHLWLQMAASKILTSGFLSDTDVSELIQIIKESDKIKSPKVRVGFPSVDKTDTKNNIKLLSIGPVEGIDRLNPKKPLDFGKEDLAVIYGQNGSGKSGFVRILKNICGKPHSPSLKPDVYSPKPSKQSCMIKYSINGVPAENIEWIVNTPAIEDLSTIDIFDGVSGSIYLENETETSYIPPELVLFTELVAICEKVTKVLNDEEQKLVSTLPNIPARYLTTSWSGMYKSLKFYTSQDQLNEMLTFSPNDDEEIKSLQQRLSTADPLEAAKKQRAIKGELDSLKSAIEIIVKAIDKDSLNDIRMKFENAKEKRTVAIEGAQALRDITKLDGVGADTWRELWQAAREYSTSNAYQGKEFPYIEKNARCPLCQQELDEEAKNRLQSFDYFIQGKLETEAKEAKNMFDTVINNLPDCFNETILKSKCRAAGLDDLATNDIITLFSYTDGIIKNIANKVIPDNDSVVVPEIKGLIANLSKLSSEAEKSAEQFEKDARTFDRNKAHEELLALEAKKWISEQKASVLVEIERLKKLEQYQQWKKETITTGISREASSVSEKIITMAYISRFNEELKKLGASEITVELVKTRATKGRSKHKIVLKNIANKEINPKDILSDGEKRIVSLAAFLADVTGRNVSTPFIFDDPISSLDQEYEEKTIERLVELNRERQVIIFTHRLSFLSIIESKLDNNKIKTVYIKRTPKGMTGEPDDFPLDRVKPDKALNELKDSRISQIKKSIELDDSNSYETTVKSFCSDFRKTIERIVEIVLLSDIIQRHRRVVKTMGKIKYLARIKKEDCDFIDEMMSKYSRFEHSQSNESPIVYPYPDELQNDIQRMIDWHTEFSGRVV